jgi:hypothetical protein
MPPAGFEPAIPASERPQTHATGIGESTELGGKSIYIYIISGVVIHVNLGKWLWKQ